MTRSDSLTATSLSGSGEATCLLVMFAPLLVLSQGTLPSVTSAWLSGQRGHGAASHHIALCQPRRQRAVRSACRRGAAVLVSLSVFRKPKASLFLHSFIFFFNMENLGVVLSFLLVISGFS